MIQITTKIYWFLLQPLCHLSTEFCENQLNNFCVILLTNKLMHWLLCCYFSFIFSLSFLIFVISALIAYY